VFFNLRKDLLLKYVKIRNPTVFGPSSLELASLGWCHCASVATLCHPNKLNVFMSYICQARPVAAVRLQELPCTHLTAGQELFTALF